MLSFVVKLKKLKMNIFSFTTVVSNNFFSVFLVFRRKDASLDKTFWRKVVWNTILPRIAQVECHLDVKMNCSRIYKVFSKKIPIDFGLYQGAVCFSRCENPSNYPGLVALLTISIFLNFVSGLSEINGKMLICVLKYAQYFFNWTSRKECFYLALYRY